MRHIAQGLLYIHKHDLVHRDVKPANGNISVTRHTNSVVLYSRKDSVWKLADFGFTSAGASRDVHSTSGRRGTPGYRAPELVSDSKGVYNNKVDVWSMGCILYELAVGRKAFRDDWAVIQYKIEGKDLELNVDETFGEQCGGEITDFSCYESNRSQDHQHPAFSTYFAVSVHLKKLFPWLTGDSRF